MAQVPEVTKVGRRTGRAELDEHAEGVHYTEMDVDLKASTRSREAIIGDIRARLAVLPAASNVGQPISHRLDHLLSGVRAQIALKIYGDDLDTLRGLAADLRLRLAPIPGLTDLQIEKQVLIPQIKIRIDYEQVARYGVAPGTLLRSLEQMIEGERITQIVEGNRRFDLVVRLPESGRGLQALANLLIETPGGHVPLSQLATLEDSDGPNQVSRENAPPAHRDLGQHRRHRHVARDCGHSHRTGRQTLARGLLHGAGRAVSGPGASGQVDRRAGADLAHHDFSGAVQPLPLGGAHRHHHGQYSAGTGGQRDRAVAVRATACRWRRWWASSR